MASYDRRDIAGLLEQHFPKMARHATSDEWHAFLNAKTGLDIPLDEPNGTAFDKWRMALAEMYNLPVWGVTKERAAEIKAAGERMVIAEQKRGKALPGLLNELRKEAPNVKATDLLK